MNTHTKLITLFIRRLRHLNYH